MILAKGRVDGEFSNVFAPSVWSWIHLRTAAPYPVICKEDPDRHSQLPFCASGFGTSAVASSALCVMESGLCRLQFCRDDHALEPEKPKSRRISNIKSDHLIAAYAARSTGSIPSLNGLLSRQQAQVVPVW